jgi:putative addiction module CopG family antidote
MTINVSKDAENWINAAVQNGRFASPDEAIDEAVRLLRQREEAEEVRVVEGIRRGLDDVNAGRTVSLEEFKDHVRKTHGISV